MNHILGKKVGMTQIFSETGAAVPVTVIEAGPVVVTQIKTAETDGYEAIQIGYADEKAHRVSKPLKGHFEKAQAAPKKYLQEVRVENASEYQLNQEFTVEIFEAGKKLDVTGVSKGKGTRVNIKRQGHHRGPMGHGSKSHREPGSTGAMISGHGGRVLKGKKLPGRMGGAKVTVQRLSVVRVDADRNLILIKGAIPGAKNSFVVIKDTVKPKK